MVEVVLVDFGILMVKVLEYCWDDDDMDVLINRNVVLMLLGYCCCCCYYEFGIGIC